MYSSFSWHSNNPSSSSVAHWLDEHASALYRVPLKALYKHLDTYVEYLIDIYTVHYPHAEVKESLSRWVIMLEQYNTTTDW